MVCRPKKSILSQCVSHHIPDRDVYICDETQELHHKVNIDKRVLYEDEDIKEPPDTPTLPPVSPVDDVKAPTFSEDVDNKRLEFMEMDKEEMVSLTLSPKRNVMKNKDKIQSLTLQHDWIIEENAHVMNILNFM